MSDNFRSSIVQALIDTDPTSGEPLDYWALSKARTRTSGKV